MNPLWTTKINELSEILDLKSLLDFVLVLGFGILFALIITALISKIISSRASAHYTILIRRLSYYGLLLVALIISLPISPLNIATLGAILTLAIGFAARSPLSNIINGLILVFEKPFVIDDEIEINEIIGKVTSIDLLSVKILTKDNVMVRIPNEIIFSNKLKNNSNYKIRRLDAIFHMSQQQDLIIVEKLTLEYFQDNKEVLEYPQPKIFILRFTPYSTEIKITCWLENANFYTNKHIILKALIGLLLCNNIKLSNTQLAIQS